MPIAATARPIHVGDARQTRRSAIRPKPIGSARSAIQTGTPIAMTSPAALSLWTSTSPPSASSVATIAPPAPEMMCAMSPIGPFGKNSPVASVSSLPSRAAIAAPKSPSQSVRFCANGPEPAMPVPKNLRETISESGSTMMPPSASVASRFSARTAAVLSAINGPWTYGRRRAP